jgi:hypothetical protein
VPRQRGPAALWHRAPAEALSARGNAATPPVAPCPCWAGLSNPPPS